MKKITSLVAAFSVAATAATQAFTIDFNALVVPLGTTIDSSNPLTINVAGYGDVKFEVGSTDVVEIGNNHANDSGSIVNSLEMDPGESILVTFLGPDTINENFDVAGVTPSLEVVQITQHPIRTNEFQVNFIGGLGSDGAGLTAVSWNAVPEPSSALLSVLGAGMLVLRRRR